jgi:putative hydrolase of the HAD superfamily
MYSNPSISTLLKGKKLLIFDFDGTVADTSHLHALAFEKVLSPLGIAVDYSKIAGLKTEDALLLCADSCGRVLPDVMLNNLVKAKQKLVRELITNQLEPLQGVDDFLKWAQKFYRLSMATSGSRGTVGLALEKLGYLNFFSPLICADEVERAKPYPDLFLKVLHVTDSMPHEALVFEDSESGFASALSAGIPYVDVRGINWRSELLNLIKMSQ